MLLVQANRQELHQITAAFVEGASPTPDSDFIVGQRAAEPGVDAQGPTALPGPEYRGELSRGSVLPGDKLQAVNRGVA